MKNKNFKIGIILGGIIFALIVLVNIKSFASTKEDNKYFTITYPDGYESSIWVDETYVEFHASKSKTDTENSIGFHGFLSERKKYDPDNGMTNEDVLNKCEEELKSTHKDNIIKTGTTTIDGYKAVKVRIYDELKYWDIYTLVSDKYVVSLTFYAIDEKTVESSSVKDIINSFKLKDTNKKEKVPFSDTSKSAWYYNAVSYVFVNNIIKGYDDTTFAPDDMLTRGMLVTILYRMEGEPKVTGTTKFSDVQNSGEFYFKSVKWATDNGVVMGYEDGTFGPEDNITREQMAVLLKRYAGFKNKNTTQVNNLSEFTDTAKISDYAESSLKWAVGAGVITGNADKTLNPKGNATRAEVAAMMEKYCKRVGR